MQLRSHSRFLSLSLLAASCVAAPLGAQQRDSTARDSAGRPLDRVVVSAPRASTTVGGASAVVVAPDSLRLTPVPVLEDALREMPFMLVRQNSRGEVELSVRGSDSRQAAVLLDGFPLTLGFDHRSDPSIVPLAGARSIVLVRGLSSLLQGPNVLGGVIELGINDGPIAPTSEPTLELRTGIDNAGALGYHVSGGVPRAAGGGMLLLRGGAGYRDRPGVSLSDDVSDPSARDDRRTNSDVRQLDAYAALRYQTGRGGWLGISTTGYQAERGVPPELHLAEPRLWRYPDTRRVLAVASGGTGRFRTALGAADAELIVGVNAGASEIESYASTAYDQVVGTEQGDDRTFTTRLLADHSLGRGELRTAFTFADVRYREVIDDGAPSHYQQRLWSVAAEVEHPIIGFLRGSAGVALDGAETPRSGDKPSLGALRTWGGRLGLSTVAFGGAGRLHASVSRRARFPALRELYSGALGRFEPNPSLEPERLVGTEIGATIFRSAVQLQGVLYHHRLSDAVVRVSTPDGKFRRENRNQIRSTGLELLASWSPATDVTLGGDLMLQRVRVADAAAGEEERRAEHQPELSAGVDAGVPLLLGIRGIGSMRHVGMQYCVNPDLGRQQSLGAQTRVDVGVDREWHLGGADAGGLLRRLRASLSLDNVADAAVYDQCGLPQPGRTLRLGVSIR